MNTLIQHTFMEVPEELIRVRRDCVLTLFFSM